MGCSRELGGTTDPTQRLTSDFDVVVEGVVRLRGLPSPLSGRSALKRLALRCGLGHIPVRCEVRLTAWLWVEHRVVSSEWWVVGSEWWIVRNK